MDHNLYQKVFNISSKGIEEDFNILLRALDASKSGVILTDNLLPDNPIIYCNRAFEEISGYPRNEIIGHNCRFLQKDDRDQEERRILKAGVQEGKDCVVEIRNYKKDGTLFYNELYMSPIKDDDGQVLYFIGVQNDVSRRKKAEISLRQYQQTIEQTIEERTKRLRDSENFLNSIIQTVRESLIVLDPKFYVLSVNEHFIKTFKVTYEDTIGKQLFDLGNGQWDIKALKELLETILPTNNPVEEFEVEHDFPQIGKKLMMLNAHRIELEGQYKDQILIAIEDVTDRREIERRKDDFLSIASHELKTPLTTIKGLVQVMQRQTTNTNDEKLKSLIQKTELYTNRLNTLITELLDVSKIQTGNIELHKERFDFDKVVRETVENLQISTKGHNIIVQGQTNSSVLADESHIVQVINNLIANAIKYSPDHGQVNVHLSRVTDYVKLTVQDNGVGIAMDDQKKIFDRFYRVSAIQKKFPGMGIGLYVCDQIIKNHKGSLWVESEPQMGSSFSFTLPLH